MNIDRIGKNAGIVWRTLHGHGTEMTLQELSAATGLELVELAAAIGWLARENKISISESAEDYLLHVFKECYF